MSEVAPEATAPVTPEGAPPWGTPEEFNPETAWNLIENLRKDKERLSAREAITPEQKQALEEHERLVELAKTDAQRKDEALARWQADAEKWRDEAVTQRVQALAVLDFADPTDALGSVDPSKYLDAGGQINEEAIRADLAAILEKKPHWRRPPEGPTAPTSRVPAPNPAQGASQKPATADPAAEFAAILQTQMKGLG